MTTVDPAWYVMSGSHSGVPLSMWTVCESRARVSRSVFTSFSVGRLSSLGSGLHSVTILGPSAATLPSPSVMSRRLGAVRLDFRNVSSRSLVVGMVWSSGSSGQSETTSFQATKSSSTFTVSVVPSRRVKTMTPPSSSTL